MVGKKGLMRSDHQTPNRCMMGNKKTRSSWPPNGLCNNRMWTYVVSGLLWKLAKRHRCEWESHGNNHKCHSSPSTTSHTPFAMPATRHTPQWTHGCIAAERVGDHTELAITQSIHPNHTLHHQLCAGQHSHSTFHSCHLLTPQSKGA